MSADLRARRRLEVQYPGAISAIRYEDLIRNPRRKVSELFRRIGVAEPNEKYYQWLRGVMFGLKDGAPFSVSRVNATATAEKWKHRLSYQQAVEIDRYCHSVLVELGYNL
jgi:Sulfotransferase domain